MAGKFAVKASGEASSCPAVWPWNELEIKQRDHFRHDFDLFPWQDGGEYRQCAIMRNSGFRAE
jgi:hypothetical protein